MKINIKEIETLLFYPDDGSLSYAVKIIHHPSGREYTCDKFQSQVENRHACLISLIFDLSSEINNISIPKFVPFDKIKILRPNTEREGYIREIIWHFKNC